MINMASQQSIKSSTQLSTRRLPLRNISDDNGVTAKQKIDMKMIRHSQKEAFEELLAKKSANGGK
jgi:hypothetical protein